MTLEEHARAWHLENDREIPKDHDEWQAMYKEWINYAFGEENDQVHILT